MHLSILALCKAFAYVSCDAFVYVMFMQCVCETVFMQNRDTYLCKEYLIL